MQNSKANIQQLLHYSVVPTLTMQDDGWQPLFYLDLNVKANVGETKSEMYLNKMQIVHFTNYLITAINEANKVSNPKFKKLPLIKDIE